MEQVGSSLCSRREREKGKGKLETTVGSGRKNTQEEGKKRKSLTSVMHTSSAQFCPGCGNEMNDCANTVYAAAADV